MRRCSAAPAGARLIWRNSLKPPACLLGLIAGTRPGGIHGARSACKNLRGRMTPADCAVTVLGISQMNQADMPDGAMLNRGSSRRRALVCIGAVLLFAVGAGSWLLIRTHPAAAAQSKDSVVPPLVTVVVPALGKFSSTVSLTGLISARNDMPIGNEGDTSRIAEVLVEAGERIRQGQVLARLNPIAAESQVHSAEASLEESKANAAVAEAEWARAQRGADLFSLEENERRRTSAATAQAKVEGGRGTTRGCAQQAGAYHDSRSDRWHRADADRRGRTNRRARIHRTLPAGARRPDRDARPGRGAGRPPSEEWARLPTYVSRAWSNRSRARSGRSAPSLIPLHARGRCGSRCLLRIRICARARLRARKFMSAAAPA